MSRSTTLYNMAKSKHASVMHSLGELTNIIQNLRNENETLERKVAQREQELDSNQTVHELRKEVERLREFGRLKDRAKLKVEQRERALYLEVERLQRLVGAENSHIPYSRAELWEKMRSLIGEHERRVRELKQELANVQALVDEKPLDLEPERPMFSVGDKVRGVGAGSGVTRTGAIEYFGIDPINKQAIAVLDKGDGTRINVLRDTLEHVR